MKSISTIISKIPPACRAGWMALILTLLGSINVRATTTTFTFTLDEPCKTSAGVYLPDGTLVRTLWSKARFYAAGTYTSNWDGLDDGGNAMAPAIYQIKLLQNNVEYVWDGAIGNTSAALSGPTVHTGFYPIRDMAIGGTNGFYASGYNEGKYDFRNFATTDPQRVKMAWTWCYNPQFNRIESDGANVYDRDWRWTATDGSRVYFACSAANNPTNGTGNVCPGFVVACNVSNNCAAMFSTGEYITNGPGQTVYQNGIYVGTQPGLSGLAVQADGNLLAVAVAPDNRIYLFDKQSGAALSSFNIPSPGRLSFSPAGSLWVVSSNRVCVYTNLVAGPVLAATLTGFSQPLAVAVCPTNSNLVLVADGGGSQQIKAFDSGGASLWTYGLTGGYQAYGPAVTTNKFWFYDGEHDGTFLCFAPDGTFWVGDGGNHRTLHFSAPGNYLEQIMYQPVSYATTVDPNNPSRVFNQFLEFKVAYTQPLQQSWTLVNNWGANLATNYTVNNSLYGLFDVTTVPNGRTYGLVGNASYQFEPFELCELTPNGLRFTGNIPALTNLLSQGRPWVSIASDGSIRKTIIGRPVWYEAPLIGFDASNNPTFHPDLLLASAPAGITDPVPRCCSFGNLNAPVTSDNVLISFDQSKNNGYHLGGIRLGTTNWLWRASPAGNLNGFGTYEISNGVSYAGNTVQAVERHIIYGYHGEFFRSQGQASQHMHFYDDGLFVGQFGEASNNHLAYEGVVPGFAGNAHCPNLIKTSTGDYYVWDNDESAHGPQRWHLVNARNIREQAGSGTLGGAITLTNPPVSFPTGVTGQPGNQLAVLSWLAVTNATLYKIYYSTNNGGPYQNLADQTASINCSIGGLTNGQTYYFAVTAITDGTEGIPSEQVAVTPFDTSQTVLTAGKISGGYHVDNTIDVNSNAPALGQPSFVATEHVTGTFSLQETADIGCGKLMNVNVGTKGFALFNWGGYGTNLVQVLPPFTVTVGSGWRNDSRLDKVFNVNGSLGATNISGGGLFANPTGTINIGASNTGFHLLTVICPGQSGGANGYTLTLSSTNGNSANYMVNEPVPYNDTLQFLFRGNVTLTSTAMSGANGAVQGLFLDDTSVMASTTNSLSPPTGLTVEPASDLGTTNNP